MKKTTITAMLVLVALLAMPMMASASNDGGNDTNADKNTEIHAVKVALARFHAQNGPNALDLTKPLYVAMWSDATGHFDLWNAMWNDDTNQFDVVEARMAVSPMSTMDAGGVPHWQINIVDNGIEYRIPIWSDATGHFDKVDVIDTDIIGTHMPFYTVIVE